MAIKQYLVEPPILFNPEADETLFVYLAVSDVAVSATLFKENMGGKHSASVLCQEVLSLCRNQIQPP